MVCFGVYILTPTFITHWIGPEYVLDDLILGLMVAILYVNLTRSTVEAYLNAYGLFSDIWAPVVEAAINIGMSVLLGYFFGLHGILVGVLLSLLIVVFCWKPYFLFRRGLEERLRNYVGIYLKHLIIISVVLALMYVISRVVLFDQGDSISSWLICGISILGTFTVLLYSLLYVTVKGMRDFTHRFIAFIKR